MTDRITRFFNQASVYNKVISNNYMCHEDIYSLIAQQLTAKQQQPLRILDLGCGDGHFMADVFRHLQVEQYIGIDLSEVSLQTAQDRLGALVDEALFLQQPIESAIHELKGHFDLIFASYVLHHLPTDGKQALIQAIYQRLKPDAWFFLIDVFKKPLESRQDYLQRFDHSVRQNFSCLHEEEKALILDHVNCSDYPETIKDYHTWARQSGFSSCQQLFSEPSDIYQMLLMQA